VILEISRCLFAGPDTTRSPEGRMRYGGASAHWSTRAIGAVVARFVHTEEVTGSNPVSPTQVRSHIGSIGPMNSARCLTICLTTPTRNHAKTAGP
jgi:hypothetical protein